MNILELKNLNVSVADKHVVKSFDLQVEKGKTTIIMGPNGSGKSTLAQGIMGHPSFTVTGEVLLEGGSLLELSADERSKLGLFLSFQHPLEIPGVTVSNFLRTAINARREKKDQVKLTVFMKTLHEKMDLLKLPRSFASRYLNEGFSGGEKKKMEILQLAMLEPKVAILDETDSGLDIDSLRTVCEAINAYKEFNPDLTLLVITHYQRMLDYLPADHVCIMVDGTLVKQGGKELVHEIEKSGYEGFGKKQEK